MDFIGGIVVAIGFAVLLFGGIGGVVNLQMLSIGLAMVTAGSAMFCAGAIYSLKDKKILKADTSLQQTAKPATT